MSERCPIVGGPSECYPHTERDWLREQNDLLTAKVQRLTEELELLLDRFTESGWISLADSKPAYTATLDTTSRNELLALLAEGDSSPSDPRAPASDQFEDGKPTPPPRHQYP